MDTYDDCCWFTEPTLSIPSSVKSPSLVENHADHHHHQRRRHHRDKQQLNGVSGEVGRAFYQTHDDHQPRNQLTNHLSPKPVSSALSSPSSGYCSSEECNGVFGPPALSGAAADNARVESPFVNGDNGLNQRLLRVRSSSTLSPVNASGSWDSQLCADQSGAPLNQHHGSTTETPPSSMHQELFDDYGAAWSGTMGFDDIEAFWEPFSVVKQQRLSTDMAFEPVGWRGGDVGGVESMESTSSTVKDHSQLELSFRRGSALTSGFSEHSFIRFADMDHFSDGTMPDCTSISGVMVNSMKVPDNVDPRLTNALQNDAYLSSALPSVGYGSEFVFGAMAASISSDLDIGSPYLGTLDQCRLADCGDDSTPMTSLVDKRLSPVLLRDVDVMIGGGGGGGGSMAGYHLQRMAADMVTGCDDSEDYELTSYRQTFDEMNRSVSGGHASAKLGQDQAKGTTHSETGSNGAASSIFSGVLGQRSSVPTSSTFRFGSENGNKHGAANTVGSVSSRYRGGIVLASGCESLLQLASTKETFVKAQAIGISNSSSPYTSGASRNRSSSGATRPAANGCARTDVRSVRSSSNLSDSVMSTSSAYPGLDDHRYTSKTLPSGYCDSVPPSKVQKIQRSGTRQQGTLVRTTSTPSSSSLNGGSGGTWSILEAFLRSTRPIDPNKGSTAALATEGLMHMHIGGATKRMPNDNASSKSRSRSSSSSNRGDSDDDDSFSRRQQQQQQPDHRQQSGTLLQQLLTGELDHSQVQRGHETQRSATSTPTMTSTTPLIRSANAKMIRQSATNNTSLMTGCGEQMDRRTCSSTYRESVVSPVFFDPDADQFSRSVSADGTDDANFLANCDVFDDVLDAGGSESLAVTSSLGADMDLSLLDDPDSMAILGLIVDGSIDDVTWMSANDGAANNAGDFDDKISVNELEAILLDDIRSTGDDQRWRHPYCAVEDTSALAAR